MKYYYCAQCGNFEILLLCHFRRKNREIIFCEKSSLISRNIFLRRENISFYHSVMFRRNSQNRKKKEMKQNISTRCATESLQNLQLGTYDSAKN